MIFRAILRALVGCSHLTVLREYRKGVLMLVCQDCPHSEPAITREPGFHRSGSLPPVITRTPKVAATVTRMNEFQQGVK